jgi:hypothetical protein
MNIDISKLYYIEFYVENETGPRWIDELPVHTCVFECKDLGEAEDWALFARLAVFQNCPNPLSKDEPLEYAELICVRVTPFTDYLQYLLAQAMEVKGWTAAAPATTEEE